MILHRYLDEHGLDSLSNCELKVCIPSGTNDPFECFPEEKACWTRESFKKKVYAEFGIEFEKILNDDTLIDQLCNEFNKGILWDSIKESKKYNDEIYMFICFSSTETNQLDQILLWSHYTNKHKGFRFHFDSNKLTNNPNDIIKIIYADKRVLFDAALEIDTPDFNKQIFDSLFTKSVAWEYEQEYRLVVARELCYIKNNELLFIKLNPQSLIQIDLGVDCSTNLEENIKELLKKEEYSHINLYRADLAQKEFKFDYVKIK